MMNITFKNFYSWSLIFSISFHSLVLWAAYHGSVYNNSQNVQTIMITPVDVCVISDSAVSPAIREPLAAAAGNSNAQLAQATTQSVDLTIKNAHKKRKRQPLVIRAKTVQASKQKQVSSPVASGDASIPQPHENPAIITHPARCQVQGKRSYPEHVRVLELSGKVIVRMTVTAQGHIDHAHIVDSSGHDVLDRHALQQAQSMICQPAMQNKQLVTTEVDVPLEYTFF